MYLQETLVPGLQSWDGDGESSWGQLKDTVLLEECC